MIYKIVHCISYLKEKDSHFGSLYLYSDRHKDSINKT